MKHAALFRTATVSLLGALALSTSVTSASAAELLVNGSFEDLGEAMAQGWGGYTFGIGYSPTLPGWNVDFGSVDVTVNGSPWGPAADGFNSLDINGWDAGQISQSFDTVLGQTYNVSFAYSRNVYGPQTATADVFAGGTLLNVVADNDGSFGSPSNMVWKSGGFSFLGTGNTETIRLTATTGGNGGVFFDNISVSTAAVPEPATWAMMITGFGIAGSLLRRRRITAAA
jgi:hypothetical protein